MSGDHTADTETDTDDPPDQLERDGWAALLDGVEADPAAGQLAEAVADARKLSPSDACDTVEAALDDGPLVETDAGAYGAVWLAPANATDAVERALAAGLLTRRDVGARGTVDLAAEHTDNGPTAAERAETAASTDEEAGSPRAIPGGQTDTSGSSAGDPDNPPVETRAREAFAVAVRWLHEQLDRDLLGNVDLERLDDEDRERLEALEYNTPRDYYRDARGWSDETIREKLLGWAPADEYALRDHLMVQGFEKDAIRGTGLFYEDLTPHFQGRYVLPYFDQDGRPVYAISRALDTDGGHPGDWTGDQKYTKTIKTKEYSHVDEPIYGAETVSDDTDRLLVAGGIADAISLHQAGFACISPVTTVRFKDKHEPRVVDLVEQHSIDGVYMMNDAERPTVDKTELDDGETAAKIRDVLTFMQYGEGLRGAFGNADFLLEEEIDPYLVELPGGDNDLRKVDPDDFIHDNWGDVETVLRGATHASEHGRYQQWRARRASDQSADSAATFTSSGGSGSGAGSTFTAGESLNGTHTSGLFDLDVTDVAPVQNGFRGKNPLGHHGDSEDYFTVSDGLATDWKYKEGYNGLTYLLVAAGERRASAPGGALDDEEILAAWLEAKDRRVLDDSDPIPRRALQAVADAATNWSGDLVEHTTADGDTFEALPASVHDDALGAVQEKYGVDPGRDPVESRQPGDGTDTDDSGDDAHTHTPGTEYRTDPRTVEVVVDARRAWDAAGACTPADLDTPVGLETTDDGDAWRAGDLVVADVARAVAVADGLVDTADATLDASTYTRAYERAREVYGAPLPRYLSVADAVEHVDLAVGAVRELTYHDLDETALRRVEVTGRGDEVSGETVRTLDPSDAWRASESGESVLVFPSGAIYDPDLGNNGRQIDPLRFVAVDAGLVDDPTGALTGETFTKAYRLARQVYGAPLPRWHAGAPDVTPVLPPADELVGDTPEPAETIDELRDQVESLYADAASDDEQINVLGVLPALGKTTAAVKRARETPTTYLARRKKLMKQAEQKAERWGASYEHLPVFSEATVQREVLAAATAAVRDQDKTVLRDPWHFFEAVDAADGEMFATDDPDEVGDDDEVEIHRPTCPTAEGAHGDAWALAVHVARELDFHPRDIHENAKAIFGRALPCQGDGDEHEHEHGDADSGEKCRYLEGWECAGRAENPPDLLIGHYTHGHVETARTVYEPGEHGYPEAAGPRTLVLDEFPGNAYTETFGDEAPEFARWLAAALSDEVADIQDMLEADLWVDPWVRAWLAGEVATDADDEATSSAARAAQALADRADLRDAADTAREILDDYAGLLAEHGLEVPTATLADGGPDLAAADRQRAARQIRDTVADSSPESPGVGVLEWLRDAVADPFVKLDPEPVDLDSLPASGDLADLVERALEADTRALCRDAARALRGGEAGCRVLAARAVDGYAHRQAHYLLRGAVQPGDTDGVVARIDTAEHGYGPRDGDGTVLKHVAVGDRDTVLWDRNQHGAEIHRPPRLEAGSGDRCPLVGLDATARAALWRVALGAPVRVRDIHDSPRGRAQTLRQIHDLQIVQTSPHIKSYEGDPGGKNLDADVALIREIADQFAGVHAPRERDGEAVQLDEPTVVTSKTVRSVLEADDRLEGAAGDWGHYGDLKGSNDYTDDRLAALLGCQHYGDAAVERFAALAGEETERQGHGHQLTYGSAVADEFLAHMRKDQTMQAALRFARGDSGALVFAHTAALRDDLPVVGEGQILETWSDTAQAVAETYQARPTDEFTVADVADEVDATRRHVRRVLDELTQAGYLERDDPGAGLANRFEPVGAPGAGEVALDGDLDPPTDPPPGQNDSKKVYTGNVRVHGLDGDRLPVSTPRGSLLPAPDASATADTGPPGD